VGWFSGRLGAGSTTSAMTGTAADSRFSRRSRAERCRRSRLSTPSTISSGRSTVLSARTKSFVSCARRAHSSAWKPYSATRERWRRARTAARRTKLPPPRKRAGWLHGRSPSASDNRPSRRRSATRPRCCCTRSPAIEPTTARAAARTSPGASRGRAGDAVPDRRRLRSRVDEVWRTHNLPGQGLSKWSIYAASGMLRISRYSGQTQATDRIGFF
jgi:hypothetical protein